MWWVNLQYLHTRNVSQNFKCVPEQEQMKETVTKRDISEEKMQGADGARITKKEDSLCGLYEYPL